MSFEVLFLKVGGYFLVASVGYAIARRHQERERELDGIIIKALQRQVDDQDAIIAELRKKIDGSIMISQESRSAKESN